MAGGVYDSVISEQRGQQSLKDSAADYLRKNKAIVSHDFTL